jgi:hypothetical protein
MRDEARDRFGEALIALPAELAVRERREGTAEVRFVEGDGDAPGLPGGTICIVSGEPGDGLLGEVREAAERGDAAAVSKVLERYRGRLKEAGERIAYEGSVARAIAALPAITEVRYRGKPIAEGMIVHPEVRSMHVLVPYAGGGLDPGEFVASTYVQRGEAPEVETVVVVREPELTPLEQKVLERLPVEVNQLAVGASSGIAGVSLSSAGLALAAGVYLDRHALESWSDDQRRREEAEARAEAAMARWEQRHGGLAWLGLDAELSGQLEQMTAGAAVETLVQIRTDLMLQSGLG